LTFIRFWAHHNAFSCPSNLSAAKNSLSRTISSLAPRYTLQGARWDYRILRPIMGDNTHISTVFKAEVIPRKNGENTSKTPQWAVIKVASPGDTVAKENMDRECQTYRLPGVNSADCFREMYDVLESSTIALEWLDTTLAEVKYQAHLHIYSLIAAALRAALTSCIVLEGHQRVNTDFKPANILLSGIETGLITAKVGDLGLVVSGGSLSNAQPYAMRAPEVFLGQACTEPSQVWAVATMLLCWIKPGILGAWDSPHPLINEAWCMAKIKRLFPHWRIPTPNEVTRYALEAAVKSANYFSKDMPELQVILPFDKEIQKVEIPQQLRDLLRFMLVVNPVDRPSPSSVLASREFRSFEKLVESSCL
ncbi:kinase-like domain-containing protein, partial [Aspergillus minisclerotigenes]